MNPLQQIFARRFLQITASALFLSRFLTQVALAQPANEPLEKFVVTDGVVQAMARSSNVLYFGGQFTQVGLHTGGGVPVSATTGQLESVFAAIDGFVYATVPDGQGGWFVGGAFLQAGGFLRTNLVHIKADRSLDQ